MEQKRVYKIPESLDKDNLDLEIPLQNKEGVGTKPLSIKIILGYFLGIMGGYFILTKSFIERGTFLQKAVFVMLWAALTYTMMIQDGTGKFQFELLFSAVNYLPKAARQVFTRRVSNSAPFYSISNIKSIEHDPYVDSNSSTRVIRFLDKSVGIMYRVVGSASLLLFESDRAGIIDKTDKFFRNIGSDVELIFITTKEAQKIHAQKANLARRRMNLRVSDPDLSGLFEAQATILKDFVGHEFKSLHQYMIVKSDSMEGLMRARNTLQSEVEDSQLMFKEITSLTAEDIDELLKTIYSN